MHVATIKNHTRGTIVGERVEIADTSFTRLWGLLGRSGLRAGGGLWIKPSSGVHTFGMQFAIDVVGLDRNLRVVKIWRELAPFRITSVSLRISSVIELAAGRARECAMEVGDVLEVTAAPGVVSLGVPRQK